MLDAWRIHRLTGMATWLVLAAAVVIVIAASGADAEEDHLPQDAPESWAMFWFTSSTSFAGIGAPRSREPWSLELFLDAASLPDLDERQRTVGFGGTKVEDLNKSPAFARPGLTIGLPWKLSVSLAYIPPIKIYGLRANLFSAAVERPLVERGPWTLGARLHGEVGHVRGAYTCPGSVLYFEPGSDGNPYGCESKSNDTAIQRYVGLELSASYRIEKLYDLAPYLALGANYLNTEFHVHARTFGFDDRTRLAADTWTFSLGAGASLPVTDDIRVALGVFYTPLWVTRPPETSEERDSLVHARCEISYRLR